MSSRDPFVEIGAGKAVFREGETGAEMFLIESGQVKLTGAAADVLGPGDFFGEDFLLDGKPRVCTATVVENARLLRLSRNGLAEVIAENPEIAMGLMRRLLERQPVRPAPPPAVRPAPPADVPPVEITKPAPPAQSPPMSAPVAAPVAPPQAAPVPVPPPLVASPPPPRPAPAPPRSFALRLAATGQLLALAPGRSDFLVGRPDAASGINPEVDLGPFDQNRSLSRRHARIVMRDGVYFVREDNSTPNGTYVNEERIATGLDVALKPGDRIRFGTIEVELISI